MDTESLRIVVAFWKLGSISTFSALGYLIELGYEVDCCLCSLTGWQGEVWEDLSFVEQKIDNLAFTTKQ